MEVMASFMAIWFGLVFKYTHIFIHFDKTDIYHNAENEAHDFMRMLFDAGIWRARESKKPRH